IVLLFLPILLLFLLQTYKTKNIRSPPGPKGLPSISNLHQFDSSNPDNVWKLSQKYGPLMSLRIGSMSTLIVSSTKMAKEVWKTHDLAFCSRPALLAMRKLSYKGSDLAFAPYNESWREKRNLCVMHLFNPNRVQQFRPTREDEVSRMIQKISKSVAASKPVSLSELLMSMTSSIICRLAFGKRYEGDEREGNGFCAMLHETEAMLGSFFFSDYFPFMGWVDKLTGMKRRLENNFKELDIFFQEIIQDHSDSKVPKNGKEDIIDIFLQIRKDGGLKVDITWDHIKAVLMNVFAGGSDSSATTIVWFMTYLMKNSRVMKKVQEEIRSEIGKRGFVDEDDVQKSTYLKAVVKESIRLQPAAPFLISRETTEKCIIEGYEIQPKTLVFVNSWAIGRDPEAWENPDEFYPERFNDSSIDFKGQHLEFKTFGGGRRICPGLHMGIATVELALANLLYKFDWKMPPGMNKEDLDLECLPGVTMNKKIALCLTPINYE
ncbi:cytochrome P450 83B1-like, partial [Pistacia vera]|uniref:cytochrome P450 83B1-like n=1 Tax=Pistacia vera TaxID=55513 RepID=UPI00126393B0